MTHEDIYPQPYSSSEQMRIMTDLQQSKRKADQDGDESKIFYLKELINEND